MTVEHTLNRYKSIDGVTFGEWLIDGEFQCYTLEDEIREQPGVRVEEWKIKGKTAIPAGRYLLTLERSNRFGPDTITINAVPGFIGIRVHGGNSIEDTEGCPIVGDEVDEDAGTISGAKARGVLEKLKERIRQSMRGGEACYLTISNP